MSDEFRKSLDILSRRFLCCYPLKTIIWDTNFNDWDAQHLLVSHTINHDRNRALPVKVSYQQAFLKWVIKNIEQSGHEVSDCIYNALGDVISQAAVDSKCYKHYQTECGVVSLCESVQIISEGTTGLSTWQAALALSEWCLANKSLLKNKTIVELGSGLGLVGLSLAFNCECSHIVLTDCHEKVLQQLRQNVMLNMALVKNTAIEITTECNNCIFKSSVDKTKSEISIVQHSWGDSDKSIAGYTQPDFILAADVVYDSSLFPCLITCIRAFLRHIKSKDTKPELILVCTERNSSTLSEFIKLLSESCGIIEGVIPVQKWFVWSTETPLRLFHISAK